jgi:TatA/E family protein of Tat protein translocase
VFGIGGTELAIIAVFAFIIFGPDKVPELARTLGKAMRTFKRAQEDMERVIRAEVYAPQADNDEPAVETPPGEPSVEEQMAKATAASNIWAATEEDDEEEDEE